jgi:hypothetical protein
MLDGDGQLLRRAGGWNDAPVALAISITRSAGAKSRIREDGRGDPMALFDDVLEGGNVFTDYRSGRLH